VWFTIDTAGRVIDARIARSSGHGLVDSAAVHAARSFDFFPARASGQAVCSSIALPVAIGRR
jgi:TonB family protein